MNAAELVPLLADLLPTRGVIGCTSDAVVRAISRSRPAGSTVSGRLIDGLNDLSDLGDLGDLAGGDERLDGVLLLDGEVASAGIRGAGVVAAAVEACRPGALVAVATPSACWHQLRDTSTPAALTAAEVIHSLEERGCRVDLAVGVGATAALAGREWAGAPDLESDRTPGLLDAGPIVLAAGLTPGSAGERSRVFFGSITTRIVAASVICQDEDGRILLIDDLFKGAWSLPGGLVDPGESPLEGARREALEEGGVDVEVGDLLGVFSHEHPHRVHLIYAATPRQPTPDPTPIHTHEVGASRWASREEALALVPHDIAKKITSSLDEPGGTWHW